MLDSDEDPRYNRWDYMRFQFRILGKKKNTYLSIYIYIYIYIYIFMSMVTSSVYVCLTLYCWVRPMWAWIKWAKPIV